MTVIEILDEEAVKKLMRMRKKADITAVGEGKTDRIFLEELVKLVDPSLLVAYMPATGRNLMTDVVVDASVYLQDIASKTERRIKLMIRDCNDRRPELALRDALNALKARGAEVKEVRIGRHVLLARWGNHDLIILALGAHGNRSLEGLGVKRHQMEDYALLCLVRKPDLVGLETSDLEGLRGETSKDILEALAERSGRRYGELLPEVLSRAREGGLLEEVLGELRDEFKQALERIKSERR